MIKDWEQFLLSEPDDLPPLRCKSHTFYKLEAIGRYMEAFNQALKNKDWILERYYIDLQAGRGKVSIGDKLYLGSPLIALTIDPSFTQYRLNELKTENYEILAKRVAQAARHSRVRLFQRDGNEVVHDICDEINAREAQGKIQGKGSTVNLAFLDPYGLELKWSTVERLARIRRMDLIINFW